MDFNQYIGKKVAIAAIPNLRIDGKISGIESDLDGGYWMAIELDSTDKNMHGKNALVDCAMITCIVEME